MIVSGENDFFFFLCPLSSGFVWMVGWFVVYYMLV